MILLKELVELHLLNTKLSLLFTDAGNFGRLLELKRTAWQEIRSHLLLELKLNAVISFRGPAGIEFP